MEEGSSSSRAVLPAEGTGRSMAGGAQGSGRALSLPPPPEGLWKDVAWGDALFPRATAAVIGAPGGRVLSPRAVRG